MTGRATGGDEGGDNKSAPRETDVARLRCRTRVRVSLCSRVLKGTRENGRTMGTWLEGERSRTGTAFCKAHSKIQTPTELSLSRMRTRPAQLHLNQHPELLTYLSPPPFSARRPSQASPGAPQVPSLQPRCQRNKPPTPTASASPRCPRPRRPRPGLSRSLDQQLRPTRPTRTHPCRTYHVCLARSSGA